MKAVLYVESRKLEGYRLPPVPFSSDGAPILPRKGETIAINNVLLNVDEVVWLFHHDVEQSTVALYLTEVCE